MDTQPQQRTDDIYAWMSKNAISQTKLAKIAGISGTVVSRIISRTYGGDTEKTLTQIETAIENYTQRFHKSEFKAIETSVYKIAFAVCDNARQSGGISALPGRVGTGKTFSLKEYCKANPRTYMVESHPALSKLQLIVDIANQCRAPYRQNMMRSSEVFDAVVKTLRGSDSLLIIDEAETLTQIQLELIRRIRDLAGIGIVLSGTERLDSSLRSTDRFSQIRSRVNMWPKTILNITQDDCYLVIDYHLGDISAQSKKEIWEASQGSMRLLCEAFVPMLKRVTNKGHQISPEIIKKLSEGLLNLQAA